MQFIKESQARVNRDGMEGLTKGYGRVYGWGYDLAILKADITPWNDLDFDHDGRRAGFEFLIDKYNVSRFNDISIQDKLILLAKAFGDDECIGFGVAVGRGEGRNETKLIHMNQKRPDMIMSNGIDKIFRVSFKNALTFALNAKDFDSDRVIELMNEVSDIDYFFNGMFEEVNDDKKRFNVKYMDTEGNIKNMEIESSNMTGAMRSLDRKENVFEVLKIERIKKIDGMIVPIQY